MAHTPKPRWIAAILKQAKDSSDYKFPWTRGARTGAWKAKLENDAQGTNAATR